MVVDDQNVINNKIFVDRTENASEIVCLTTILNINFISKKVFLFFILFFDMLQRIYNAAYCTMRQDGETRFKICFNPIL